MSVGPKGNWVVTAGKDRHLRLWNKTNDPIVLSDEREQERQKREEEEELSAIQRPVIAGETEAEAVRPTKLTVETEKAVSRCVHLL